MRLLTPIFFVVIAAVTFFSFATPVLEQIDELKLEQAKLAEGIVETNNLVNLQDQLMSAYNAFSPAQLNRLDKMLPNNIDNVRLIIDINNIARQHGMGIKNIAIRTEEKKATKEEASGADLIDRDSVILGFSVSGSYNVFKSFLNDLADSLRLVDVASLGFSSNENNSYDYNVALRTYWLK